MDRDAQRPPEPDEFELSDFENEAFIPHGRILNPNLRQPPSVLMRCMPVRARKFVENLSRIKVMIICLILFIAGLAFLGWNNDRLKPMLIPPESRALSIELLKNFANTDIPEYVLTHAPLVVLEKSDMYFPSDLATHIRNTHPTVNFTPIETDPLGLAVLDVLNDLGGEEVYITSTEDLETLPEYLHGQPPSKKTLQTEKAISTVVIVVDKGDSIVDAFYMYFYTFNKGPTVFGHEIGNHLGDWEHTMLRFKDGMPIAIWYSQHDYGAAFTYNAVQKLGIRPVCYSAKGSHANYPFAGKHDLHDGNEELPENLVFDYTSQGLLWDPTLSAYYYTYSPRTRKFIANRGAGDSQLEDEVPIGYLYFNGKWGDQEYADDMPEQSDFHGFHKWTGGPQGPFFKHLDREDVCWPSEIACEIRTSI